MDKPSPEQIAAMRKAAALQFFHSSPDHAIDILAAMMGMVEWGIQQEGDRGLGFAVLGVEGGHPPVAIVTVLPVTEITEAGMNIAFCDQVIAACERAKVALIAKQKDKQAAQEN